MNKYVLCSLGLLLLSGCAGKTTDPRKGGLFSYNPDAYEKRLSDRQKQLNSINRDTRIQKNKNKKLKNQYNTEKSKIK